MKNIHFICIAFAIVISITACTKYEKIENFPIEQPSLVANSLFQQGKIITIDVSRSLSVLDNAELTPITDARVILYVNDIPADTIDHADADNKYYSSVIAQYATNYKIQVSHPKYKTIVSATESLPPPLIINDFNVKVLDSTYTIYNDYYTSKIDTLINYVFDVSFVIDDQADFNTKYMIYVEEEDSTFYNNPRSWERYTIFGLQTSDPAVIKDNQGTGNNIYYSIYLDDYFFNGSKHKFICRFENSYSGFSTKQAKFYLDIKSFTETSYKYFRSLGENYDQSSPFDEPKRVFSNITNGYGIFAGEILMEFNIK